MMLDFPTNVFLTQIGKKYAIFVISTKNIVIYEAKSINMWILADKACRFTNFSPIMS